MCAVQLPNNVLAHVPSLPINKLTNVHTIQGVALECEPLELPSLSHLPECTPGSSIFKAKLARSSTFSGMTDVDIPVRNPDRKFPFLLLLDEIVKQSFILIRL